MINLKKTISFAFIASLLGATSAVAYKIEDDGDDGKHMARKKSESSEEPIVSASTIIKQDDESAAKASTLKKQEEKEAEALETGKARLRALAHNKDLVITEEEKSNLRAIYEKLSKEDRENLVTSVAEKDGKLVKLGGFRIGPSNERVLKRFERRLGLK